jgi:hypothetical protein
MAMRDPTRKSLHLGSFEPAPELDGLIRETRWYPQFENWLWALSHGCVGRYYRSQDNTHFVTAIPRQLADLDVVEVQLADAEPGVDYTIEPLGWIELVHPEKRIDGQIMTRTQARNASYAYMRQLLPHKPFHKNVERLRLLYDLGQILPNGPGGNPGG